MKHDELDKTMVEIQKLCTELNDKVSSLEEVCRKMGSVKNDEDRELYCYYSEKMNEVRSYLVFQSKRVDNRRARLRDEIAFYDFMERKA